MPKPHVIILAGPNGAGKSTTAPALLAGMLQVAEFVNADVIAQGLSGFRPDGAAMAAGRIMVERIHQLADERVDFAFETTLASRTFAPWLKELKQSGYAFHLIYLWLSNPELAVARVLERFQAGGHNVPEATIRRRYAAGLRNFFELYQPLADTWRVYDHSEPEHLRLIATNGRKGKRIHDKETWQQITSAAKSA